MELVEVERDRLQGRLDGLHEERDRMVVEVATLKA